MPLRILLNGAKGRMGQAIASSAQESDATIIAALDAGDNPSKEIARCDVIIDFSSHEATLPLLELAVDRSRPIVIGTTGHAAKEKQKLQKLAARVPCVWTGNFSVGVNLLYALTRRAAATLGPEYDVEILEMHHRFKKDAPSGTAARLLEIVQEERKVGAEAVRTGRSGIVGARPPGEIGVHSIRGGDVVGDHDVIFATAGERLVLSHRATDRAIFARGALRAARWVIGQPPGIYDMQDVLGLR